jgi:hypothetical protein
MPPPCPKLEKKIPLNVARKPTPKFSTPDDLKTRTRERATSEYRDPNVREFDNTCTS